MAIRLTGDYYDIHDAHFRVDIYDQDFSGSSTAFDVKYCNINYDSENNSDPFSPIVGSRAEIGMTVHFEDTVLPAFIEDFALGAEDRFFVEITKVLTSLVVWRGILTPDFTGENDTAPLYVFKVSAVCGLATLKKRPYHDGAAIFTGIERLTGHLKTALSKISHTSLFWGTGDIFMKTAVDWWAAAMDSGADDDALYQAGVDHAAFYDYKTQGNLDKDVLSCYDVIAQIMRAAGSRVLQVEGVWWMEQIEYRTASPYTTRHYDVDGAFIASATNSGANVINQSKFGAKLATVQYDFLPALERAEVTYNIKLRRNFLAGTSTTNGNWDEAISSNMGTAIMRLKFTLTWSIKDDDFTGPQGTQFFLIPHVTLKVGANYLTRDYTIANFSAFVGDLEWDTAGGIAVPIAVGTIPTTSFKQGSVTVELITPPLPTDGDDNFFGVTFATANTLKKWNGDDVDETDFTIGVSITDRYLEIYDQGTPIVSDDKILYTAENPGVASEIYETEVRIGSADLPNSAGRLLVLDGADWVDAGMWGAGVGARDKAIGDLLAASILNFRTTPKRRMGGSFLGDFRQHRLMQTNDGKKWILANTNWDIGKNQMQGSWYELAYGSDAVNSTPIKIKVLPPGDTPTVDPTGSNQGISNTASGFNANPPPTVLAPIAFNALETEITVGDTITSIPIKIPSTGAEFLPGDGVRIVSPITGQFQTFEIATAPSAGDDFLSVVSTTADYDFPEDSYLVVQQNAYSFRLPQGTHKGDIMIWDDVDEVWVPYSGTTDGHVLTWDTTNGWQSQAGGGGVADGDYGDITVSSSGTVWNIDAGAVGTTELAADSVTFSKIQNIATDRLLGRDTAGSGDAEEISLNATLEFTGAGAIQRAALTGDVTATAGSNATSIAADAVTDAKLRNSAALSVIGRSANSVGDPADIAAANDGEVLRRSGVTLGFGTVATAGIANDAVTYAKIQNVSAQHRVLGRKTAGAGDVEEMALADLQTSFGFLDGALTTPRIPYASDGNTLTDNANLRFLVATEEVMNGDGAALDGRYSHRKTANIAGDSTFIWGENNVSGTYAMKLVNNRNTGNTGISKLLMQVGGANAGDCFIELKINGLDTWTAGIDNSDADKFKITPKSTAPGSVANSGISITNEAAAQVGINIDAPGRMLDVGGGARAINHIMTSAAPTVVVQGTGLGTGPSIDVVDGGNNGFHITFTTGTAPVLDGQLFKVTYANPFTTSAYPVFIQRNKKTADQLSKFIMTNHGPASFVMSANGTLDASTQYSLQYNVFGL